MTNKRWRLTFCYYLRTHVSMVKSVPVSIAIPQVSARVRLGEKHPTTYNCIELVRVTPNKQTNKHTNRKAKTNK